MINFSLLILAPSSSLLEKGTECKGLDAYAANCI